MMDEVPPLDIRRGPNGHRAIRAGGCFRCLDCRNTWSTMGELRKAEPCDGGENVPDEEDIMAKKWHKTVRDMARERGWAKVELTGAGHFQITHSDPLVPAVHIASTPNNESEVAQILRQKLQRAEREGAREREKQEGGGEAREDESEAQDAQEEAQGDHCPHCGQGPFSSLGSHTRSCRENPDAWEACPGCGKPCCGPTGLAAHKRACEWIDEDGNVIEGGPDVQEDEEMVGDTSAEASEAEAEEESEPAEAEMCGATTAEGAPCSNRVKGGGRCAHHREPDTPEIRAKRNGREVRQRVRGVMVDLLREYDDWSKREEGSLFDFYQDFHPTLETSVDLVVEAMEEES